MGVVMWQMASMSQPYNDLTARDILVGLNGGGLSLPLPSWCEPEWQCLVEAALSPAPDSRPPFRELADKLQAVMAQIDGLAPGALVAAV